AEHPAEEGTAGVALASQIGGRRDHLVGTVLLRGRMFAPVDEESTLRRVSLQGEGRNSRGKKLQTAAWVPGGLMLEGEGDLVGGDGAFAKDHPGVAASGEIDDGGGGGAGCGPAVDDEGEFVAELLADA